MRITIQVEDDNAEKLVWEVERRTRAELGRYPAEERVPMTNMVEPMPAPKPERPRKRGKR